jgi:ABC-type transporter Mla maintaining outer membrane lipid asymmetry permease subunit MlaE
VGAGIGAELGGMKVTEQIDAMEASAVNPYKYLAVTRVVACTLMLPLLTLAANFCGILAGWIATTLAEPISLRLFIERGFKMLTFNDFLPSTAMTAVFGLIIGLVASFQGMRTKEEQKVWSESWYRHLARPRREGRSPLAAGSERSNRNLRPAEPCRFQSPKHRASNS